MYQPTAPAEAYAAAAATYRPQNLAKGGDAASGYRGPLPQSSSWADRQPLNLFQYDSGATGGQARAPRADPSQMRAAGERVDRSHRLERMYRIEPSSQPPAVQSVQAAYNGSSAGYDPIAPPRPEPRRDAPTREYGPRHHMRSYNPIVGDDVPDVKRGRKPVPQYFERAPERRKGKARPEQIPGSQQQEQSWRPGKRLIEAQVGKYEPRTSRKAWTQHSDIYSATNPLMPDNNPERYEQKPRGVKKVEGCDVNACSQHELPLRFASARAVNGRVDSSFTADPAHRPTPNVGKQIQPGASASDSVFEYADSQGINVPGDRYGDVLNARLKEQQEHEARLRKHALHRHVAAKPTVTARDKWNRSSAPLW